VITFFGLHFGGMSQITVDVNELVFNKVTLRPAFAEPAINFPLSNRLLRDGLVDAQALVTHTFGFEHARETLGAIVDGSQPIVKAVMLPNS
jgi:threonine dehydrogenase-like Zn-dependent dehydrogenase